MNYRLHTLSVFAALAAFGLPSALSAQQPAPAAAPYLLGPDDQISIQVLNFPELCIPQVTVPSDGKITVPDDPSSVPVAGKTTTQVAAMLQKHWSLDYVGAFVTVTLLQRRHQNVQVYGFVTHPEAVEYQPGLRLSEALANAGGAAENGDLSHVAVSHPNGKTQTVNAGAGADGGPSQDITLAPNDSIFVPQRHQQISVLGEVAKPGSYEYKDKMTVLDALKDADNINAPTADLSNATLRHNGTDTPLDLNALLKGGQTASDVPLSPGDSILVPILHNRIFVDGEVGHPGYYAFQPGDRLNNAISGSGGTIAGASDLKKVTVVHQDKKNNTVVAQTVDFGRFLQHGDMTVNLPLQPDDAIYIPVKGSNVNPLQALGSIIGIGVGARGLGGH